MQSGGGQQGGREIHVADELVHFHAAVEAGTFHDERNVNRAFVRAAFVLRVAGAEVIAVIAGEHDDGVLIESGFDQRLA